MKIIIFCGVEFTFEKFILSFAKALNKENNEIFISYNKNEFKDRSLNKFGFKFIFNPIERKISILNLFRSIKKLLKDCRRNNIDLIHCHTPIASISARLAGIFLPKVQIIYTCHGLYA